MFFSGNVWGNWNFLKLPMNNQGIKLKWIASTHNSRCKIVTNYEFAGFSSDYAWIMLHSLKEKFRAQLVTRGGKKIIRVFLKSDLIFLRFTSEENCRKIKYFPVYVADKCFCQKNSGFSTSLENIGKFQYKYSLLFLEKEGLHVDVILNMWEIAIHVSSKNGKKILFLILFRFFSCLPTEQKQRREYFWYMS